MRDLTYSDLDRLAATDDTVAMDEDTFRAFYDQTARQLWAYLARATGDRQAADDLLQEAYFRLVRARVAWDGEAHRRHYLFRIAMNLVRDARRRPRPDAVPLGEHEGAWLVDEAGVPERVNRRADVTRALERLGPRDRDLLWCAYALGSTHEQIATATGLRVTSIKQLLFRARRRFAVLLGEAGRLTGRAK
jgi:RNA polymerase sigma-70 factor (ECF subfamily)